MTPHLKPNGVPSEMITPPKTLKRSVPGYEGFYSITTDGDVYSDNRVVQKIDGKMMRVKERILRETRVKFKGKETNCVKYRLCVEGLKVSISKAAMLKRTFPDLFKPVEDLPGEIWKVIPEHTRYAVSNLGRVKRLTEERVSSNFSYTEQSSLRHIGVLDQYMIVCLQNNDEQNTKIVARLVFEAFYRPLQPREHVLYKDGDYTNIKADNLIAKTMSEYREKCPMGRLK